MAYMKRITSLLLLLIAIVATAAAQDSRKLHKFVVADIETHVPVRGVIVFTGDGYRDTTNYRGVCYIPEQFDTLSVYKSGYLTERMLPREIKDSTFLIPNNKRLDEVVVWGQDPTEKLNKAVQQWYKRDALDGKNPGVAASLGFDFAGIFDKQARRDAKHLRRVTKSFNEMDKEDDDPIVAAYKRVMEQKKKEEEYRLAIEERTAKLKSDAAAEIEKRKVETKETAKKVEGE